MNFNTIAKEVIGTFLTLFDFFLKEDLNGIVKYDHKIITIILTYDFNRSYEVNASFFFKKNDSLYTLAELKEYLKKDKNRFIAIQILEEDELKTWCKEVKDFLENYLDELLNNDVETCVKLESLRNQNAIDYNNKRDEILFNEDVGKLWRNKDYTGLVRLIENYNGNIEGVVKKKYEYAIKKIR